MSIAAASAESLARIGCNISVDGSQYAAATIEALARIIKLKGTNLTIRNADKMAAASLDSLARIAGTNLTIEI